MLNSLNYAFQVLMKSDGKITKELAIQRDVMAKLLFEFHKRKLIGIMFNSKKTKQSHLTLSGQAISLFLNIKTHYNNK
jgi:hypothetical protein